MDFAKARRAGLLGSDLQRFTHGLHANNSIEGEQLGISSWGRRLLTCVPIRWTLGLLGRVDLGGCPPRPPTDPGLHITRTRFLIS